MAKVDDWFMLWIARHIDRIPRADWPDLDTNYWPTVKAAFVRHGVTETVADAASELLAEAPPTYPDRHLEALLAAVRRVWRASEVPNAPRPSRPGRDPAAIGRLAAIEAKWAETPEADRAIWRSVVCTHNPGIARWRHFVESLAMEWCFDPSLAPHENLKGS